MSDQFQQICEVLRQDAGLPPTSEIFREACHARLIGALRDIDQKDGPGPSDLACLVRHMLQREAELQQTGKQSIRVTSRFPFPDRFTWEQSGVTVLSESADNFVIHAHPWQPRWLRSSDQISPEAYACAEAHRRTYEPVDGDPVLSLIGHESYRSVGQREATRAALLAPPGSTLVINLPTGAGKSLCAQLPALLLSSQYGVTVVVVPTTALALDQERAMSAFIEHPTAYYSDGTASEERRKGIRERIRTGTQRVVFTSPESVLESLAPSLYKAAENGMLRMFVIDEAHMIEQWGDDFRPAFQELPGMRKDLLRVQQGTLFKTLLMTGTLTEACLDTIEALYSEPGPFDVISAAQLRPEPSYWSAYCESESLKIQRVMEAIRQLPRPLILYTTKREDAAKWAIALRRVGFTRFATVTGDTTSEQRKRVIEQWRGRKIDIVVATAAFGLGVDQADVRAVIHACIPETLDRFYQEVGRGGRDGKSCVSLLAYTKDDCVVARNLNERVSIGIERGRQRWERMFASKEWLPNNRLRVRVDVTPSNEPGDINMNNEQNRKWNVRTLTLMSCARLVSMDAERPHSYQLESTSVTESSQTDFDEFQSHQNHRVIRLIDEDHLQAETWDGKVETVREKRLQLGRHSLRLMEDALKGKQCIARLLAEAYRIPPRNGLSSPRRGANVSLACGGCPFCRANQIRPYATSLPTPRPVWSASHFPIGEHLQQLLQGEMTLAIFYERYRHDDEWEGQVEDILLWLLKQGIRNVIAPDRLLFRFRDAVGTNHEHIAFFYNRFEPLQMPPAPSLVIHPANEPVLPVYFRSGDDMAARIFLLPVEAYDPVRPHRLIADSFNGRNFKFEEFRTLVAI